MVVKLRIPCILFEIICFVLFRNGHFHNTMLFRRLPLLLISTLKMTKLFRRCLYQRWNTQHWFNVVRRCKFQRWNTQRCSNVDLTLPHAVTSYQPKDNVETMLKCLHAVVKVLETLFWTLFLQKGSWWLHLSLLWFLFFS